MDVLEYTDGMTALDTVIEPEKVKVKDEAVSNFVTSIHSGNLKMS